jgi:heterodisulfide reductase subunit A-like polyferredoxin
MCNGIHHPKNRFSNWKFGFSLLKSLLIRRKNVMRKGSRNVLINASITKEANGSAIIVGASLSGLMTGIALSRAGVQVTILERAGAKPRSGAVLQVDSGEID